MNDDTRPGQDSGKASESELRLVDGGIEVEEPFEIESIELIDAEPPRFPASEELEADVLGVGGGRRDLERLEEEHLQLAAEVARLRADAAARERVLEEELEALRSRLVEREAELTDQVAQIASLTLTCDGLRSRLADEQDEPRPLSRAEPQTRQDDTETIASLKARLEERGNALLVAREEIECLQDERNKLAEALAERGEQVAQLLGQVTRAEVRSNFGMDFRSSLRRLLGRESVAAPAAHVPAVWTADHPEEPTIVVEESPRPASPPATRRATATGEAVSQPVRKTAAARTVIQRFLLSLEQDADEVFELRKPRSYVGRGAEADVRIEHETVSRLHGVLYQLGGATIVEDACSTNGVFVNRQRVRQAVLRDGDTVAFGSARYQFRIGSPPSRKD